MTTEPTIACPHCNEEIRLTESLAAPLIEATRADYEARLTAKENDMATREAALQDERRAIKKAQKAIDDQVAEKLRAERPAIAEEEKRNARALAADEVKEKEKKLATLEELIKRKDKKLEEAQNTEAEMLKTQRALEEKERELDLTIEKRVSAEAAEIRKKASKDADEEARLKVAEKEETIAAMGRQIEDLKRKAEQGSQQLQGEAQELVLEEALQGLFPYDVIEPVPKGEFGGDVLQRVASPSGKSCGTMLWESKRTKNWSDGWLQKLRGDQRTAKAEIAVLVTQTLPKGLDTFGQVDGVWVSAQRYALPLAIVLRQSLVELHNARRAQVGQESKMELVYQYLTGPKFKHRIEAIVEKFSDMRDDLHRERKFMQQQWAKRDTQLHGVIDTTVGLHGDLQGIAGAALQEIDGLETPLLESDAGEP
ncbi:MAG: DUF2130 domain-containing protein [Gammaproteobacteria bacterium]|nr:DUF2130 domain-containing protein [Gammaproteobacteria bacterium]